MHPSKVITYHRIKVRDDLPKDHPAYGWRGKEGRVEPPHLPYVLPREWVHVKLDDHDSHFILNAADLDSLSNPLPVIGDIVVIKAKVIERRDDAIFVAASYPDGGTETNWMDRNDVLYVAERRHDAKPEPVDGHHEAVFFEGHYRNDAGHRQTRLVKLDDINMLRAARYLEDKIATDADLHGYVLHSVTLRGEA